MKAATLAALQVVEAIPAAEVTLAAEVILVAEATLAAEAIPVVEAILVAEHLEVFQARRHRQGFQEAVLALGAHCSRLELRGSFSVDGVVFATSLCCEKSSATMTALIRIEPLR